MTRHLGRGVRGMVVLALAGCGGTVDLHTGGGGVGDGGSSGSAGSRNVISAGGVGSAGVGNTGGASGAGVQPSRGALAYDVNLNGEGRAVFVTSFEPQRCTQRLTSPAVQAKQPAFSADGTQLVYAALSAGVYQLHVRDLVGGGETRVTNLAAGATSPAFSPDGTQIAFSSGDPEQPLGALPPNVGDLMLLKLGTHEVSTLAAAIHNVCCHPAFFSPFFNGPHEVIVSTGLSILGINLESGAQRDLVPITGRIPTPQDPTPEPGGVRYAFTDSCGGALDLFIGRLDGTTGDTCAAAFRVPSVPSGLAAADWGPYGFIAAESAGDKGIVLINDKDFSNSSLSNVPFGRNPAWAPTGTLLNLECE